MKPTQIICNPDANNLVLKLHILETESLSPKESAECSERQEGTELRRRLHEKPGARVSQGHRGKTAQCAPRAGLQGHSGVLPELCPQLPPPRGVFKVVAQVLGITLKQFSSEVKGVRV